MKKFFVLYSLKQKLTPTLYKTKSIVTKHASTNKSLKFEQFETEMQAKSFIDQIVINTKQNENSFLTQTQINQILHKIVPDRSKDQASPVKLQSSMKKKSKDSQKKSISQSQWAILPNGHGMRVQRQEESYDSGYSSLQQSHTLPQQSKSQMQLMTKSPVSTSTTQNQSESTIVQEEYTTDGNTEEGTFPKISKKSSKKQEYWVLYNKNDFRQLEFGKKLSQMGKILYQLEEQYSAEWIKLNITTKQFKLKKDALSAFSQLQEQKKIFLNKIKGQILLERAALESSEEKKQQKKHIQITADEKSQKEEKILIIEPEEQKFESQKIEEIKIEQTLNEFEVKELPRSQRIVRSQNQTQKEEAKLESPRIIQKDHPQSSRYIHPYNKVFIRQLISSRKVIKNQKSESQAQYALFEDEIYEVFPLLSIRQNPGISVGEYQVKSREGKLIRQEKIILGQTKRQEGNLLALAFSLSSLNLIPENRRIKIHLNQEMHKARTYAHKFDHRMIETKEFVHLIEEKFKGRVEYVV